MAELFDAHISLLGKSMDFRSRRNALISSNVANLETPGYKARDLVFEKALGEGVRVVWALATFAAMIFIRKRCTAIPEELVSIAVRKFI